MPYASGRRRRQRDRERADGDRRVAMTAVELAAVLGDVVVLASMLSVELGMLLELGLGVLAGNLLHLDPNTPWLVFVAQFASIVLSFLAGAEVDPDDFRERFGASVVIGAVSFIGPFIVAWAVADQLLDWTLKASLIAGTALSTTSLAVVYAVLVETGLNQRAWAS
jgi:Kef-type K+ transport system membrane component KefB